MLNDFPIRTAVTRWKQSARQCWASYKKPPERLIAQDFANDELETGLILLRMGDFLVDPETACAAYPIFFYARESIVDFYLLPLLSANLQDYMRSGLSDRLAEYIGNGAPKDLVKRFGIRGLCLMRDYFETVGRIRGRELESEQRAKDEWHGFKT